MDQAWNHCFPLTGLVTQASYTVLLNLRFSICKMGESRCGNCMRAAPALAQCQSSVTVNHVVSYQRTALYRSETRVPGAGASQELPGKRAPARRCLRGLSFLETRKSSSPTRALSLDSVGCRGAAAYCLWCFTRLVCMPASSQGSWSLLSARACLLYPPQALFALPLPPTGIP